MTKERKEEIEQELHELNEKFFVLKSRQRELWDEKNKATREKMRVLIGRCFYDDRTKRYFIITDAFENSGDWTNPYQIPIYAFYTDCNNSYNRQGEFCFDTFFSHCCESDEPLTFLIGEGVKEISMTEFLYHGVELFKKIIVETQEAANE